MAVESDWTVDTLREYLQRQIDDRHAEHSKALEAALQAVDKATSKTEAATEKRFDAVNEFRKQLGDQAGTFMPRAEANVRIDALAEKLDVLQAHVDTAQGRQAGIGVSTGVLVGSLSAVSVIIGLVIVLANLVTGH